MLVPVNFSKKLGLFILEGTMFLDLSLEQTFVLLYGFFSFVVPPNEKKYLHDFATCNSVKINYMPKISIGENFPIY